MVDRSPTSEETLRTAFDIARKKLHYVYVGNILIDGTEDTRCAKCGAVVVRRVGYDAEVLGKGGKCPSCGTQAKGVWS
jgi:pyruvate formate lyase activating enzyme